MARNLDPSYVKIVIERNRYMRTVPKQVKSSKVKEREILILRFAYKYFILSMRFTLESYKFCGEVREAQRKTTGKHSLSSYTLYLNIFVFYLIMPILTSIRASTVKNLNFFSLYKILQILLQNIFQLQSLTKILRPIADL